MLLISSDNAHMLHPKIRHLSVPYRLELVGSAFQRRVTAAAFGRVHSAYAGINAFLLAHITFVGNVHGAARSQLE